MRRLLLSLTLALPSCFFLFGFNAKCGDLILDKGEECDDGNNDSIDGCSAACVKEFCGDGEINSNNGIPELCDDANAVSGDGCNDDCQPDGICGDGVIAELWDAVITVDLAITTELFDTSG